MNISSKLDFVIDRSMKLIEMCPRGNPFDADWIRPRASRILDHKQLVLMGLLSLRRISGAYIIALKGVTLCDVTNAYVKPSSCPNPASGESLADLVVLAQQNSAFHPCTRGHRGGDAATSG